MVLPADSALNFTNYLQEIGEKCFLKHQSNAFKNGERKKVCSFWRGRYCCRVKDCATYEFEIKQLDENTDSKVLLNCKVRGEIVHNERISSHSIKRFDSIEKTKVALHLMSNSNNIETLVNSQIADAVLESNKIQNPTKSEIEDSKPANPLALNVSFENLKGVSIKNQLKDRYRKILNDLHGKLLNIA